MPSGVPTIVWFLVAAQRVVLHRDCFRFHAHGCVIRPISRGVSCLNKLLWKASCTYVISVLPGSYLLGTCLQCTYVAFIFWFFQ